jgi:hypothetical protein
MPQSLRTRPRSAGLLRFRSTIAIKGINPYVPVTAQQAARLRKDWRGPMPVCVQINGQPDPPWRINLMPRRDGSYDLYLAGTVRKASGTQLGDAVSVCLQFDTDYRNGPLHAMPPWFGRRLQRNRAAQAGWERLPPSRQKEILRYFAGLRSAEAQQRNAQKALRVLAGEPGRFMARDWNSS